MKVLVTGANGQLGFDLIKELVKKKIEVIPLDVKEMDLTDKESVNKVLGFHAKNGLDAIIHCAAYTAVDKAEDESNLTYKVNVLGTSYISDICKKYNITLMYISTDYVFDGQHSGFIKEDALENPINIYGMTKHMGELLVKQVEKFFIVRISWVFGINGNNFIKTMLNLAKSKKELSIIDDQVGSPTYTKDLSVLLSTMIQTKKYGIYHATNEGVCSWYEFAKEIFKKSNIDITINRISSDEYITKAKRPKNSKMSKDKLVENGFKLLPDWKDALDRYLSELEV